MNSLKYLIIVLFLPISLQASDLDSLINECNASINENDTSSIENISSKLLKLDKIPWAKREDVANCINKISENELIYSRITNSWESVLPENEIWFLKPTIRNLLGNYEKECAKHENGTLKAPKSAIIDVDLTGDGETNTVIHSNRLDCSSSVSIWSDSGGGIISLIVNEHVSQFHARSMAISYPFGNSGAPIIIFAVHGGYCGVSGSTACVLAAVWGDGKFEFVKNSKN